MRTHLRIMAAIGAAIIVATGVYLSLADNEETIEVVVAAIDIDARSRITHEAVRTVSLPASAVHPHALTASCISLPAIVLQDVFAGQQLLNRHVAGGEHSPLSVGLAYGCVAFMIPGQWDLIAGGAVEIGDRVDIIFVADQRLTGQHQVHTLLESVKVVDIRAERGQRWESGSQAGPIGIVAEITLSEAEQLALALAVGDLYVALTGPGVDRRDRSGVSLNELMYDSDLEDDACE